VGNDSTVGSLQLSPDGSDVQPSKHGLLVSRYHQFAVPTLGMICRHTWHPRSHSRSSDNDSRHSCSLVYIRTFLFDLLSDILRGPCNS